MTHISAVFDTEAEADRALADLRAAGVPDRALSIIARHDGKTTETSGTGETHTHGGSILRGLLGGGALGAGLGVAALAIPGVGPLAAIGAIAAGAVPEAMAIGGALGATAGALNEVFTKHGATEEEARYYDERVRGGATFVSVNTNDGTVSPAMVEDILYRNGGHNAGRARMGTATTASTY
ncbi:hypothetical protein [Sphingomonas lenta]|uniref:DUF1269 domain-containing protein n=1 Tax=Sphingomonas lenta TaxID=1141887 RepID=A0A2A2SC59_9SPHN|nr:hypothetical protein [Sphingomonas lenta]PAX06591.1 hypothetical protein CKY28_15680 [Sphingomonas lenta]